MAFATAYPPLPCLSLLLLSLLSHAFCFSASPSMLPAGNSTSRSVSYDSRAILIDGQRKLLISASIHYPRSTPEMWADLIAKAKAGGVDVIESYLFWDAHEPAKGQYIFDGNLDLVRFIRETQNAGLYFHLRIGPYACAEWNYGGFPAWLHFVPGIELRTDNAAFKAEMETITRKIVGMLKDENLFYWQGGPVILTQIENEYGNIDGPYGDAGKRYIKWAAQMAVDLDTGAPWIMCQQSDAPDPIINACNGFYCDNFTPNSPKKPKMWTENWTGWFRLFGGLVPSRPVEDIAYAVARFFQTGGTFQNYYMYHGGTNFGRTGGGPFISTSYDYDAPLDEYGLLNQPKWGHLTDLHKALRPCEKALLYGESNTTALGHLQEATVYETSDNVSCAFLANKDTSKDVEVRFRSQKYVIPAWSVSILSGESNQVIYNTAMVRHQTTVMSMNAVDQGQSESLEWEIYREPIALQNYFKKVGLQDQMNTTRDVSDYLWYTASINATAAMDGNLKINSQGDSVLITLNGDVLEHAHGSSDSPAFHHQITLKLKTGQNELALLGSTVGLKNYGSFFDLAPTGITEVSLSMGDRTIDLSQEEWTYQIGLQGESIGLPSENEVLQTNWVPAQTTPTNQPLIWYKTTFDFESTGSDPVAIDLSSMGKGKVWINGNAVCRYWPSFLASNASCQAECDYRGAYSASKCQSCKELYQQWFHVPRSWLRPSGNTLVIFEEVGGDPTKVSFATRAIGTVCGRVSDAQPDTDASMSSAALTLDCGQNRVVSSIQFASYGNSAGSCVGGSLKKGSCHAQRSMDFVTKACVGKQACTLEMAALQEEVEDPCEGTSKSLTVEAICSN